jgi:hypothetical protein
MEGGRIAAIAVVELGSRAGPTWHLRRTARLDFAA